MRLYLREMALTHYYTSELPVWRRSGFWITTLQALDLDALEDQADETEPGAGAPGAPAAGEIPDVVTRTLPERPRAGRLVQSAGGVVHVEVDPALKEQGV